VQSDAIIHLGQRFAAPLEEALHHVIKGVSAGSRLDLSHVLKEPLVELLWSFPFLKHEMPLLS
jgi:hypothetical protein